MDVPDDLRYSPDHEWVRVEDGRARIGITDYAQDALGDVVFVSLPAVGAGVKAGDGMSEIESTKSVSDIYAPVTGTVVEVDHPTRGKYLTVGNPIKLSDSISEVKRSPLLGEHTDEILRDVLKFTDKQIEEIKASGATGIAKQMAAE